MAGAVRPCLASRLRRHLADLVAQLARPNLRIIPATDTPLDYLGAADLAVCTSYEESFPRVVMEAMAARVPILSTGVHGIGDMLASGRSGWLVPAGETHALTDGLHHLLSHPTLARTYAEAARVRVVEHFDAAVRMAVIAVASTMATSCPWAVS